MNTKYFFTLILIGLLSTQVQAQTDTVRVDTNSSINIKNYLLEKIKTKYPTTSLDERDRVTEVYHRVFVYLGYGGNSDEGSSITVSEASAGLGVKITSNYIVGVGGAFIWRNERVRNLGQFVGNLRQEGTALRAFNRYFLYKNHGFYDDNAYVGAYLQAEYELVNIRYFGDFYRNTSTEIPSRQNLRNPLIGLGIGASFEEVDINVTLLYNLAHNSNTHSIYHVPFRGRISLMF